MAGLFWHIQYKFASLWAYDSTQSFPLRNHFLE